MTFSQLTAERPGGVTRALASRRPAFPPPFIGAGRTSQDATFVKVAAGYAERLIQVDGRPYLSGLGPHLTERLRRTGRLGGPVRIL